MANNPYWNSCVLAMHMDDTGLTDAKGHTVTLNGNVARSSAQKAPLTGNVYSAIFDGSGDYIDITTSADFDLSSGDFYLRFWAYGSAATYRLINRRVGNAGYLVTFSPGTSASFLQWTAGGTLTSASGPSPTANAWNFVEIRRAGNSVTVAVNCSSGTPLVTTDRPASTSTAFEIGRDKTAATTDQFSGYIDEIELYKGPSIPALRTTVPTEPFSTTMVQVAGTTRDSSNALASRKVYAYRRSDGALAGSAISNATTGAYSITALDNTTHFAVCLDNDTPDENALILDLITPV